MIEPQCFCDECEKAMAYERSRIIKLLEEQAEVTGYVEIELGKLVAFIKGEQE